MHQGIERDKADRSRNHKLATWETMLAALQAWQAEYETNQAELDLYLTSGTLTLMLSAIEAAEKEPS